MKFPLKSLRHKRKMLEDNRNFVHEERIAFLQKCREDVGTEGERFTEPHSGTVTLCQGKSYCTNDDRAVTTDDNQGPYDKEGKLICQWCKVIRYDDKRTSSQILHSIVVERTTMRH